MTQKRKYFIINLPIDTWLAERTILITQEIFEQIKMDGWMEKTNK